MDLSGCSGRMFFFFFFFNDTATTEIYTLSLHDALPIYGQLLRIVDAQLLDIGSYFCLATNDAGNATKVFSDRKSTRLNSSHPSRSRMPSSA